MSAHRADDAGPAVRARGLRRVFNDRPILEGLDLEIGAGEFVARLGRSGSGKTTLLRAFAGLDEGIEGTLSLPDARAVVFQEARLLPWKRVHENVSLGLAGPDPDGRARAALREVGLDHRTAAWPLTLSGGEAQRAGLARALVRDPALLLLDEPFAALDALTRLRMQDLGADRWRRHGCAGLLVTHDVDEAIRLADRILLLDRGRIVLDHAVEVGHPRRHDDPALGRLRQKLLDALGVPIAA